MIFRAKQNEVWKESSLDSIDAASTPSRKSQDSLNSSEIDMRTCNEVYCVYTTENLALWCVISNS